LRVPILKDPEPGLMILDELNKLTVEFDLGFKCQDNLAGVPVIAPGRYAAG
jgi:hypothetical protein